MKRQTQKHPLEEKPIWSFVIRRSDGTAVARGEKICWEATGDNRDAAEKSALAAAAKHSKLPIEALSVSGCSPFNWAAEERDHESSDRNPDE